MSDQDNDVGMSDDEFQNSLEEIAEDLCSLVDGYSELSSGIRDSEEIDRLNDVAMGLEQFTQIGGRIKDARATEVLMAGTIAQLACAGTNLTYGKLLPGLEDSVGKEISMEGLKSFLTRAWTLIRETLERFWDRMRNFFYRIFGAIPRLRRVLTGIKERLNKRDAELLEGRKIGKKIVPLTSLELFVNKSFQGIATGKMINDAVKELSPWIEFFMTQYPKKLNEMIASSTSYLDSFSTTMTKEMDDLLLKMNKDFLARYAGLTPSGVVMKTGVSAVMKVRRAYLPAGWLVEIEDPRESKHDHAFLKAVDIQTSVSVKMFRLLGHGGKAGKPGQMVEINSFTKSDALSMCDSLINMCNQLEKFERSGWDKKYEESIRALKQAGDNLDSIYIKREIGTIYRSTIRSAINYAHLYGHRLSGIQGQMARHAMQTITNGVTILRRLL